MQEAIAKLEKKGFRYQSTLSDGSMVFKKTFSRISHFYAEVETDGSVNGQSVEDFLAAL